MIDQLVAWLLNWPDSAYDSMKRSMWLHRPLLLWDRVRVKLAKWLMGGG